MIIEWSDEDALYIVTVPELPGCRTHGATQLEAVEMGQDAIATWLEANRAWGRPIPAPHLYADRVREEDAADTLHNQIAELGSDEGMTEGEMELLHQTRPGVLPWERTEHEAQAEAEDGV